MVDTLTVVARCVPSTKDKIQTCLLDVISRIFHKDLLPELIVKTPTTPTKSFLFTTSSKTVEQLPISDNTDQSSRIVLALTTLGSFDFDLDVTKRLIQSIVDFLDHESSVIRKKAVTTCARLLQKNMEVNYNLYNSQTTILVIKRLLNVAIIDEGESFSSHTR